MAILVADSAAQVDVEAKIADANEGDTVEIPDGTESLSSKIVIAKRIQVLARNEGGVVWDHHGQNDQCVSVVPSTADGEIARLAGIRFTGAVPSGFWNGVVSFDNNKTRIDHIDFANTGDKHAFSAGSPAGGIRDVVLDNITFGAGVQGMNIFGDTGYWTDPTQHAPGTNFGIYVEDSVFNVGSGVEVLDMQFGGAYIVRYCTIHDANLAMHGADSSERGGGYFESYNNTFINTDPSFRSFVHILRAGVCYLHNNDVQGNYNTFCDLQNWRTCWGVGQPGGFTSNNANRCENGSLNPLDEDLAPRNNGWP